MKKNSYEGNKLADLLARFIITFIKWVCFVMTVIFLGFSLGLLVMYISKGSELPETFLSKMYAILSGLDLKVTLDLIKEVGVSNVVFSALGHGLIGIIIFGIQYIIIDSIKTIYKSIKSNIVFTEENIKKLNNLVFLSLIMTFVPLIISYFISSNTSFVDKAEVGMYGIIYFCIAYISKIVFIKGYELENKVNLINQEEKKLVKKVTEKKNKKTETKSLNKNNKNKTNKKRQTQKKNTKKSA